MHVRCLIVDDNPGFLQAACRILEQGGISVVGVASTGSEALRRTRELKPDVALMDIDLGRESGFDVARQLVLEADGVAPTVIFISTHAEQDFTDLIADSPAAAFVSKADLSAAAIQDVLRRDPPEGG
jgi:two-component system, NarL family, nitrate/nitrite response regulator NarL